MAGFAAVPKLLLLLMVAAACTAKTEKPAKQRDAVCDAAIPVENCLVILSAEPSLTVGINSIEVKARFLEAGSSKTNGALDAKVVIDSYPSTLKIKKFTKSCQKKKECTAFMPCFLEDGKVVFSVKKATVLDLKLTFTTPVATVGGTVNGTLWTSCGEKYPLTWVLGPDAPVELAPEPVPGPTGAPVPVLVPEPAGAPVEIAGPEPAAAPVKIAGPEAAAAPAPVAPEPEFVLPQSIPPAEAGGPTP